MIYVSSACVNNKYICETIEQYAKVGIKNIELSGGTRYYKDIEKDLSKLRKKYNLKYVCHAYFPPHEEDIVVNLASCNDDIYRESIEHYVNCLEMLSRLEIEALSFHAGFLVEVVPEEIGKKISNKIIYPKEEAIDRFISAYQYIGDLCKKAGVELYLENNVLSLQNYQSFQENNYMMMTDSCNINRIRERLDFNLLLDLGHLFVSTKTLNKDYAEECNDLMKQAKWLHISDNNGVMDQHLPLTENSPILQQYYSLGNKAIDITLETCGEISEIIKSIDLL